MIGQRLGPYEVLSKLGEGGMGAVFRARDTKLDRDVAIKILPEAFAHDADRLARFTREAKTLASLNRARRRSVSRSLRLRPRMMSMSSCAWSRM